MRLSLNIGEVTDRVAQLNFDVIRRFFLGFILANFEGKFVSVSFTAAQNNQQFTPNPLGYVPTDYIQLARLPWNNIALLQLENCTATQLSWWVSASPVNMRCFVGRYRSSL